MSCRQLEFDSIAEQVEAGEFENRDSESYDSENSDSESYDYGNSDSESGTIKNHFDVILNNSRILAGGELSPKIGTVFETEKEAYGFYLKYSKKVGFGVRKSKSYSDKYGQLIGRTFCCRAQGKRKPDKRSLYVRAPRPETRFGCQAKMKIKRVNWGKFEVIEFVEDHVHHLTSPDKTHLHRSHRNISSGSALQIDMANDVGIQPKVSHELLVKQAGGRDNLGFTPVDYKNYLRSKRTVDMKKGDTGGVLEYLQKMQSEDPNFFSAIQVDEDDLITNIFWTDAQMRKDYSNFGDVVCFDTTYRKNSEGRPLAIFVGVNHHKQSTIFGGALLYDETALTFEWLFDTFARAMSMKKPKTILTDEDPAMAKALLSRWPETKHRLCIWHIYQNAAKHLSGIFSEFKDFSRDFSSCVYDYEEEAEFVIAWEQMLQKYGLEENAWLKRIYGKKEKWALVYGRQVFCADMTTTQRSESMNSLVKRYVSYKHDFLQFFNHFQRLIDNRRYDELVADFIASTSTPVLAAPCKILKHAVSVYTPTVFKWFQEEWNKSLDSEYEIYDEVGTVQKYKISPGKRFSHLVTYDSSNGEASCSCRKFDFAGILCSHVLKVFTLRSIFKIPSQYVLKRWTRKAKTGYLDFKSSTVNEGEIDPKLLSKLRYKEMCALTIQLVMKAAERGDTTRVVKDHLHNLLVMVDELLQGKEVVVEGNSVSKGEDVVVQGEAVSKDVEVIELGLNNVTSSNRNALDIVEKSGIRGIKMKERTTTGKRLKSGLGKTTKSKKKKIGGDNPTPANVSLPMLNLPLNLQNFGNIRQMASSEIIQSHAIQPTSSLEPFAGTPSLVQSAPNPMSMTNLLKAHQSPTFSYGNLEYHCYSENIIPVTPGFDFGNLRVSNGNENSTRVIACNEFCGCAFPCLNERWCICKGKYRL